MDLHNSLWLRAFRRCMNLPQPLPPACTPGRCDWTSGNNDKVLGSQHQSPSQRFLGTKLNLSYFSWRRFSYRLSLQFGMSNFWTFLSKITWHGNFHHMVKSLQRTKHALKKYTPSFKSWHRTDPDQTALETPGPELWLFQLITSLYAPFSGTI